MRARDRAPYALHAANHGMAGPGRAVGSVCAGSVQAGLSAKRAYLSISIPPFSSGNVTFFQQPKLPPVRPSDPTVQFSVGPTVRTYTRNVPILRTFFITEFREPAAPQNLVKKTSKFSSGKVKVFQWKSQTFPVEKSNFSSRKAKLFQWKSQTFPVEKSNFSSGKVKHFRRGEHAFSRGKWKLAHRFRSRMVV